MNEYRLGVVESHFADIIWQNAPLSSGQLVKLCQEELSWKKPTTYTTLKKLCEKGFAKNENTIVTSLIHRDSVQKQASERFVENTFEGSLPKFLVTFLGGKTLSEKESEELKRLIDQHKEK